MQGEEACHMKKQMRDIPETLQDKMGQKMRLTVNVFAVPFDKFCDYLRKYFIMYVHLYTHSKPFLTTDTE